MRLLTFSSSLVTRSNPTNLKPIDQLMYLFKLKQVIKVNMSREYIAILLRDERLLTKFAWLQNETKPGGDIPCLYRKQDEHFQNRNGWTNINQTLIVPGVLRGDNYDLNLEILFGLLSSKNHLWPANRKAKFKHINWSNDNSSQYYWLRSICQFLF